MFKFKDKTKLRTLYFEKLKVFDSSSTLIYYIANDDYINRIVGKYCVNNKLTLKQIELNSGKCKVKIYCTREELSQLYLHLLLNHSDVITNLKY